MPLLLPSPEREKRLGEIQKHLAEHKEEGGMYALNKAVGLMLQERSFQQHVARSPELLKPLTGEAALMTMTWSFLYRLLYDDDLVAAAMVLWDSDNFTAKPHCVQLVWDGLMHNRMVCVIGAGGVGKTYSTCAYFLLQWLADPEWTRIQVASASKDHLEKNALGDLFRLYSGASLALPGKADTVSISLEKKRAQGIFSLILPGGPEGKSKLKGSHMKPRPEHPKFGRMSRVFCLIDESQEVPMNIFSEIPNRFSGVVDDGVLRLQFVLTANPKSMFSKFGECCKPKIGGWEGVKRADQTWMSAKGWFVISVDAMRHENVIARKAIYPRFVTWGGVMDRLNDCGGNWDDPRMWTYVYGKFPPMGLASAVIKQHHLARSEGEWIFDSPTVGVAGADPAFTGDRPTLACGRVGRAIAWIDFAGERHPLDEPRWAIQIDADSSVTRGDTQELSDEYLSRLKPLGVLPGGFGIDMTGSGRGVHDISRRQWGTKVGPIEGRADVIAPIVGIEYGSSPSTVKIADEDTTTPKEMFDRIASELWFAAAKLFEFDVIRIGKGVDVKVFAELAARSGGMQPGLGKKLTIESKTDYKIRTGMESPDLADAALVMIHVARISTPGLIPRAKDTAPDPNERAVGAWSGFTQSFGAAAMTGLAGSGEFADVTRD